MTSHAGEVAVPGCTCPPCQEARHRSAAKARRQRLKESALAALATWPRRETPAEWRERRRRAAG